MQELGKERGLSYGAIAEHFGVHEVTISNLARGATRMNEQWQRKFAELFQVPFADIMERPALEGLRRVAVRGKLQAGAWAEGFAETEMYDVIVLDEPSLRRYRLYGREIVGESMNKLYPDGSVAVMSDLQRNPEAAISGKCYHVEVTRADGMVEETVKKFARYPSGEEWLLPESDLPGFNAIRIFDPLNPDANDSGTIRFLGRVRWAIRRE